MKRKRERNPNKSNEQKPRQVKNSALATEKAESSQALSWKGVSRGRRPGPVAPCRTPATGYTLVQKLRHHVPKS